MFFFQILSAIFVLLGLALTSARPQEAPKYALTNRTLTWNSLKKTNDIKPTGREWDKFKVQFGKKYSIKEENFR